VPYWRLFYHLVWATRERQPLISTEVESLIAHSLRATCNELKVIPHAIGMMPDHVHVAASIPPSLAVSTLVGRLKGAASHAVNATGILGQTSFAWQSEYGALSFGEKALSDVIAYVTHQQERHAAKRLWQPMEQVTEDAQPA